jgi:heptosyltransferase II
MSEDSPHRIAPSVTPNSNPQPFAKVLIRAPNWVGDAVMALPALRELRRIFTGSQLTLAARPWVRGLFDGERLTDNLISVNGSQGFFGGVARLINEAGVFRGEQFDFGILLTNSFGTALAARAGGVKKVAGYATDARRPLLNQVIPFEPGYKSLHQVRYYLNIAAHIETSVIGSSGVNLQGEPQLTANDEQRQNAGSLLERFGINTGESSIVVINPGATNSSAKRWPAERFATTADRLSEEGFQTVIVGTEGDKSIADEVARQMRTPASVIAGETTISELKGVLACARLVISNDTGTAHVSAALGVPTVVVFGPTEHVSTRPLSRQAEVVRHDVECSPCMLRECPIDHRCMTRVEADDVYAVAQKLLLVATGFTRRA